MAKNKDDEFDFEWDDDSSFDSKLDDFGGDVDEYHGDEIESAEKDRNPVAEKLKSITPTINTAGSAIVAGAGKGIGRAIEDDMPEVYQAYQQGTHILSEATIARQEISDKFRPWWNDTKRAVRRLSQQLEGQMPFGLDKKILKLIGEEDSDQQYRQPSKESMRQEQMNSNINQIFELQMQKSMEQQKDTVLNRTYDRRVDAIRHKESAGFLAKIAESSVFHQAFTNSVFTAYLKKDLELKYKQFYATEDILGVMTNHAKAVDTKLDAVIKNTALPEADKIYMSERIIGKAKENVANAFNDKLNNYFSKMRENVVNKFKDMIDLGELIPEILNMQSEMLEITNDEDMQGLDGSEGFDNDSVFTKKGLMKLGFGKIGDFFGRRILRKLTSKLPQETLESLKYYFGGGQNGLALLTDDLARGRIKGLPSELRSLIRSVAPRLSDTTQTVVNESWQTLHEGGKITNKFIQAVEEVIPGYLKMQTRYLEILATGKDSGLREWDPRKHTFRTQQELLDEFVKSISIKDNDTIDGKNRIKSADARIKKGAEDTRQLIQHVSDSYGAHKVVIQDKLLKAQRTSTRDIELFKVNLAHSEDYWRIDENILSELNTIANAKDESEIRKTSLWKAKMFEGIDSPVNVAGFWLDILADRTRDGLVPNKVAIDHVNALIVRERIEYSGRYRSMLEQRIKDTGQWFLLDKFSKQDSNGNYIVDESGILRQQMNTTSSNNELMQKLTPEQLKFYNQTFLDIKDEEKNKKNWFGKWVKGFKEKLSKFDLTEFTDDIFKEGFINLYKKFNGENSDKDAEKKWGEILKDVDKFKKFVTNNYEKLSSEVKKAWDRFEIKTFDEALTVLGEKVDHSFWNLRDKLIYEEDGKKKLKNISELTEEEWYDWFVSIENIDTVLDTFNGKSALSQVLRSVLPDHIQHLLIATRNDKDLIKKMKANASQYSGKDTESVNKRMKLNKEIAKEAIEKANKAITSRMTSHIGSTTKSNMDAADYKALREDNIKMHEDKYNQMIKVDTEKLDENSQIDISKEQLKILRNIDNQLGVFYHAFIDPVFRQGELLVFNQSKGRIDGDDSDYMHVTEVQSLFNTANAENLSKRERINAFRVLQQQHGFNSIQETEEWLNSRNDVLKDTRSRLDFLNHYNTGAIDITSGAKLLSNTELDKLTSDEALKKKYGENTHINSELRYQEKYDAQRKMLRKYYIQLLKTSYIRDNGNNPIYTYFATLIVDQENYFVNNINATIKDEDIYNAAIHFIRNADEDDSRSSVIRYLKLLLIKDKNLTSSVRQEDIRIGIIQEFLPIKTSDLVQYALNYVKEVEAHGNTSANAIIEDTKNVVNISINNSSYDDMLNMRAEREKELSELNKQIENIYNGEDDVYISKEDKHKVEELLINRDTAKVGLKTIDTAIKKLENSHIRQVSNDKTSVYADSHSLFINKLIEKSGLDYNEAIKTIENIGKSSLRRQNTDNKLISNSQYADMQKLISAVDAIKTNFSTEEDIAENGQETLNRMLTDIYQYIKQDDSKPILADIENIYRVITGKPLEDVNKSIRETHIPTAMEDAFNRAKDKNNKAKNKHRRKYASGESYDRNNGLSYSAFRRRVKKYHELGKLAKEPLTPDVIQKMTTIANQFMYGKSKNYKAFRPYFMKLQSYNSAEAICEFLHRHPEYRDEHLEQLIDNACYCVRDIDPSIATSQLTDNDTMLLQMLGSSMQASGPCAIKGRTESESVILYPKDTPVIEHLLYHELGHIKDANADATNVKNMKEYSKYSNGVMSGHYGKGSRLEHHADWFGIKKAYAKHGVSNVHDTLKLYMKDTLDNKHTGDIYIRDTRDASPRIAITRAGVENGAYAYKVIHGDGKVEWIPLTDTYHISRPVYKIKDAYTGKELNNPTEVISIKDIRNTQRSMQTGDDIGLVNYNPTTNTYMLTTDKSDMKYRTNLMYRALRRYGMDPNKGYAPDQQIKMMYAKGESYTKVAQTYAKQLAEDKEIDNELRKKYRYGEYFDEKYSNADLMQIRSSLSPQEQQIFDTECVDFNNSWIPRFINRLKPFRSNRWEKHTNGVPVIDANKINQNIEFSSWDREYINALLNALETSPAAADTYSKLIWAKSDNQNKLPKGVLLHEASHVLDKDALPTQNIDTNIAHSGKGARFEKRADWNAVKRLLASGDIKGVRGYINWLQQTADKLDPNNKTDLRWRANLLTKAVKHYGYDLNQGLKHKKYAKGDSFDYYQFFDELNDDTGKLIEQYPGYDKISEYNIDAPIKTKLEGLDYRDIEALRTVIQNNKNNGKYGYRKSEWPIEDTWNCKVIWEFLLPKAPILDVTEYYRDYHDIPDTVKVVALQISNTEIAYSMKFPDRRMAPQSFLDYFGVKSNFNKKNGKIVFTPVPLSRQPESDSTLVDNNGFWQDLEYFRNAFPAGSSYAVRDETKANAGLVIIDSEESPENLIHDVGHELGHILDKYGKTFGVGGDNAHRNRGHYSEKRADIYGLNSYLSNIANKSNKKQLINNLLNYLNHGLGIDEYEGGNEFDQRWRMDLMRRYMRMRKHKGDPLYANFQDKYLQSQFRNKYAKGDNISFDLPIDQYGGYVDQPTEILGGTGIAGEAGGETILPHKFNERFKELIYRCLRDTVGENVARRVLGMLNPSETTENKLGILLSDNDKVKFASGGSTAPTNDNIQTDTNITNNKDEYTRKYPTDTIKNILLNIMESNEAIYSKLGDGLLVVDLAAALDKLKNSELINKLKNLKIGDKIKDFIFGTYNKGKGLVRNIVGLSTRVAKGAVNNVVSFGRHLVLGSKVCDVFLKSDIEGQVHGDKKISAAELENGTIFSDSRCTKPIYSVADIYPPVYRKKIDEIGNTTIEEAITEEEAKRGLVDFNGNPLIYFGGKIGRFLHNIAMKPINAIFSKSALEKVKNIGSTISSGIRHGFDGLFGAYCDVYSARDPEKMLVSGTSIKEGRLVRIPKEGAKPKVVPTVFDIDGECWIMIDDPNDATKRILGDKVICDEDIKAGLQHRDGTPIESSKLSLVMSKLRRLAGTVGGALAGLAGGAFGIAGKAISFVWEHGTKAAGWIKDRIVDAFTAKDPYIDVCIVKNGKLEVVITGEDLKTNKATLKYCFRDDEGVYTPVLSAYGIDSPVYTMVGKNGKALKQPRCVITKEDLDNGVFDTNGDKLTKWAGRSLAGKIGTAALGAVKLSWKAIKGIGKGIWNVGAAAIGKLGSLLGEGGAAVTSIITNAWNSTLDLFRNTVISRKDLQEIVGDRLLDIYGLLYKHMPRKTYDPNDKDGDGDVDGSWADYEQKRKERENKREQERSDKQYKDHPNTEKGDDLSFMSKLKNAFVSGFGGEESSGGLLDWILGGLGIKSLFSGKGATTAGTGKAGLFKRLFSPIANLFSKPRVVDGKLESGKLYKLGKGIKEFFTGNKLTGKTGILDTAKNKLASTGNWFKGLFGKGAATAGTAGMTSATSTAGTTAATGATSAAGKSIFTKLLGSLGPKVAARAAAIAGSNVVPILGQIASVGMTIWSVYEIGKWLITDSPKTKNMRSIRCKGYGVNSKYWEAIIDLETDTFDKFTDGNTNGVDRDRLVKFGYKVDFLDLSNPDSEKLEFLTTWYRQRFIPAYNFYLGCMRTVGVEFDDNPPKDDDIPGEKYAVFVTEFTKHIDKFSNGPTKILRLDNSAYTAWLAHKHEKERDEGLTSSKYSDSNLKDKSISKSIENPLDNLGYAWNELKHGNLLNSLWFTGKAILSTPTYIVTKTVDSVWKNITSYLGILTNTDQRSNNEKAWDEVRFRLYGLDKDNVGKEEYSRITKIIKDFEIDQVHVIDGEQQILDDELKDLAKELFPAKVRKEVKNRLMLASDFTDKVSDDLLIEARSFVFSWYRRIFVPIFTAYARVVRAACGDKPGDNISIDSIPEENRLQLLKEFERQSNKFLATNIDTEILRLSSKGFYDFLVMRSEEDKAELAKDTRGLLTEEETTFSDKLSRDLNKAGKDFSDAWDALKHLDVTKAINKTVKGIGNTVIGVFKSIGTSIGESVADFLHGSKNEHAWEKRFFDYGFMDRAGSSDIFANDNIKAMNKFENEAGRILSEDNTSKPDDKFFISLAFNCKYIEKCCASLFGIAINDLETSIPSILAGNITGKLSLSAVKTILINQITSKLAENKNKAQQIEDVSQKIADMLNYLDFWYTFRFKPVFSTFINVVSQYGVDAADIDVDDIPVESRKEALEQYSKMVGSVLKKNNIQRYNLSPEGLAIYLNELYAYREDIKDGKVDNKHNPLAAYYKEKEETYKNEVINAVIANASALSKEDKAQVANSLAKASTEIDSELNDVSLMATLSAKDALKDLGVDSLIDANYNKAEATIVGKLMELTTGYNNYDRLGVGSGWIWDDKLGKVFTDFMKDAHKYLYEDGSAEDLHEALTKFMNIYLASKVFRTDGLTQDVDTLDSIMLNKYPHVAASNATFKYFANWFSHRFIPYYTYYVTLVNKANKVNDKAEPELNKLTATHRRYVLMKLLGADKKNLIPSKAKALKLTQQDMDDFYRRENVIAEQRTQTTKRKRQSREDLQKQLEDIRKRYEEKRNKIYAESNNTETNRTESNRTEINNLSTIKAVDGVATGATVGGRYAKNKGTSLSDKDRQYVWDFLVSQLGLTEPQAAAVMGNMMQESGLSCDVVNGIGATGICQWLGNRLYGGNGYIGLIPFAKANGLDYMSVEAQMKYLQWELTHNKYERDRFDTFVRSIPTDLNDIDKTIAQCTVGFRKGFERCGEHEANDSKRVSYAKAMYNTFNTSGDSTNARNMNNTSSLPSNIASYNGSETSTTQNDKLTNVQHNTSEFTYNIPDYFNQDDLTKYNPTSGANKSDSSQVSTDAVLPTDSNVITSQFGQRNVKGGSRNHKGIDLRAHTGSPIKSMKDGVVIKAGGSYNEIFIQDDDGVISKYLHNSKIYVRNGQHVHEGDIIASAGGKGPNGPNQYGSHLHLGIFKGNTPIDPEVYLRKAGIKLTLKDTNGVQHNAPLSDADATGTTGNETKVINPEQKSIANSDKESNISDTTIKTPEKPLTQQVNDTVKSKIESDMAEASANAKAMYTDDTTTEQIPSYTYTNMTGEGDNKHILTQNTMQSSITGANNGSAPIVAELQLISKILAEFRGDVVGFISKISGAPSSRKTEQSRSVDLNNKAGLPTANNVDENTIKEIGDKLIAYVSDIIGANTKSNITPSKRTSNTLANTYPLSSSKTR